MDRPDKRQEKEARKGWLFILIIAALILKLILQLFGIDIDSELTSDIINAILGLGAAFGVYRNNYIGKVGRAQYALFKDKDVQKALEKTLQQLDSDDLMKKHDLK